MTNLKSTFYWFKMTNTLRLPPYFPLSKPGSLYFLIAKPCCFGEKREDWGATNVGYKVNKPLDIMLVIAQTKAQKVES